MPKWKVFYKKPGQESPFLLVEADTNQRAEAAAYCALDGIDVYRVAPCEAAPTTNSKLADLSVAIGMDTSEAVQKVSDLQAQADTLLATLEKCKDACASCALSRRGADLVAVIREYDYRSTRTE